MPQGTFTPWQYLPPYGFGSPGSTESAPPPNIGQGPYFRDALDARRSMHNQTPEAMYPDGYLGTINTRRGDRLLDSLKSRQNQRSYQRGVHKGERIDLSDYFWPGQLQPERGLQREATTGLRDVQIGVGIPQSGPKDFVMGDAVNGVGGRSAALKRLAPAWR